MRLPARNVSVGECSSVKMSDHRRPASAPIDGQDIHASEDLTVVHRTNASPDPLGDGQSGESAFVTIGQQWWANSAYTSVHTRIRHTRA